MGREGKRGDGSDGFGGVLSDRPLRFALDSVYDLMNIDSRHTSIHPPEGRAIRDCKQNNLGPKH